MGPIPVKQLTPYLVLTLLVGASACGLSETPEGSPAQPGRRVGARESLQPWLSANARSDSGWGWGSNRCKGSAAPRALDLVLACTASAAVAQDQAPTARPFSIVARRYRFDPPRIEVDEGDLVKIDLHTIDIAHSLTLDEYRISKRVSPDSPVTFEFRAATAGRFPFYCNLQIEDGCRQMRGELVVKPRR